MATTTLNWTKKETNVNIAFVGDATNPAFTVTETSGKFYLESHITGSPTTEEFADLTSAKAFADGFLAQKNIPQTGTMLGDEIFV